MTSYVSKTDYGLKSNVTFCTACTSILLGSVHYLWEVGGGGQMGGGQAKFTPLFRGGGRKVLLWIWGRGGGGGETKKFEG